MLDPFALQVLFKGRGPGALVGVEPRVSVRIHFTDQNIERPSSRLRFFELVDRFHMGRLLKFTAGKRHARRIIEPDDRVRMVHRSPVPVAVYQATRMLTFVSAPLSFLLLPRIRHASTGLSKILVDLVVRYVVAASSEFVKEEAGAQPRLFPGRFDRRLLFNSQARLQSSLWIADKRTDTV